MHVFDHSGKSRALTLQPSGVTLRTPLTANQCEHGPNALLPSRAR